MQTTSDSPETCCKSKLFWVSDCKHWELPRLEIMIGIFQSAPHIKSWPVTNVSNLNLMQLYGMLTDYLQVKFAFYRYNGADSV